MSQLFVPRSSWVLSGSVMGWGGSLLEACDAIVFLTVDADLRMSRLRERELARYGDVDEAAHEAFFEWAQSYDDPSFSGRSRARHERWLATIPLPVLRLDGALPVQDLVEAVDRWLDLT
jgi:hypothetical protein